MKYVLHAFSLLHAVLATLFACAAVLLTVIAVNVGLLAIDTHLDAAAAQELIESVGLLAAAVVALQISQTIAEEEVVRAAHVSAPTRVRRFLSRFLVVAVVALAIECLVATFRAIHEDLSHLLDAAALVTALGVLLAGWGIFVRLNTFAEALEPEAMQEAKREDAKLG